LEDVSEIFEILDMQRLVEAEILSHCQIIFLGVLPLSQEGLGGITGEELYGKKDE
jgi:hypothetical protein